MAEEHRPIRVTEQQGKQVAGSDGSVPAAVRERFPESSDCVGPHGGSDDEERGGVGGVQDASAEGVA
ncbi:hypothetical protein NJ76_24310 [Rhodococcus sp. IITR03]|nr:hypothetical protein NJ76_24310 [Rhodococcus sp. IITR03]